MEAFSVHRVLNGTWGELWVDGNYIVEVTVFKAKVTLDKTDVNMVPSLVKAQKIIGN